MFFSENNIITQYLIVFNIKIIMHSKRHNKNSSQKRYLSEENSYHRPTQRTDD